MTIFDSLPSKFVWVRVSISTGARVEEKFGVNFEKPFVPELVLVKNIGGDYLGCNSACKIFDSFSTGKLAYVNEAVDKHTQASHHR